MNVADDDSGLTEHDRRAIAEIQRELDAEFGPAEPVVPVPPAVPPAPAAPPEPSPRPRRRPMTRREPRRWSTAVVILAFVAGALSSAAGVLYTLLAGPGRVAESRRSADEARAPTLPSAVPTPPARSEPPPTDVRPPRSGRAIDAPPASSDHAAASVGAVPSEQRVPPTAAEARARREIRGAVMAWIDAQRRRDLDAQMRFYPQRVSVFYRARDVDRRAVRAEKARVLGDASNVELSVGEPIIAVDVTEGRATTRFRKRYAIQGPHVQRHGEVVQELRWLKLSDGWKIVAERDAEVLVRDPGGPSGAGASRVPVKPTQGP